MAHVRRLDANRWQARYRDAEHHEHARNFATKIAAQRWLDAKIASIVRSDYVDPRAGRATIGVLAETWYATKAPLKLSSRLAYRSLLDTHVLPRWRDVEVRNVTTSEIAVWVATVSSRRSASTTRKALSVLHQILALAVADRRLTVNPASGVAQPRLPVTEERFLTASELDRLACEMPSDRDRALTLLLGWVGLRFGEAAALRRTDVDILRRRARIQRAVAEVRGQLVQGDPKTHAARTVGLPAFVADELAAIMQRDSDGPIFASGSGSFLRVTAWKRRIFDPAARRAELNPPALRVHDLRHTAASLSIASGASVKVVQSQLGHRSAMLTLDRYGHLFPDDYDALTLALEGRHADAAADSLRIPEAVADVVELQHTR